MLLDIKYRRFKSNPNWEFCLGGKFLGVKFDHKLTFDQHVNILLKEVNAKSKVLACFTGYVGLVKKNIDDFFFVFCSPIQLLPVKMDDS